MLMAKLKVVANETEHLEPSEDLEQLEGLVEVNTTEIHSPAYDHILKRIRLGKIVVAAAAEVRDEAKPADTRSGRTRVATLSDSSAASIECFVRANVKAGSMLRTDGHKSYLGLTDYLLSTQGHGKPPPRTQQVWASMKQYFRKPETLDRGAIDTGLKFFVKRENQSSNQHVSFEALLRLALHHEPISYRDIVRRKYPRKKS